MSRSDRARRVPRAVSSLDQIAKPSPPIALTSTVERLLANAKDSDLSAIVRVLEIGLHHEQQHQELILTDILHAFSINPVSPVYDPAWPVSKTIRLTGFAQVSGGIHSMGFSGDGYCFDNEQPVHRVFLQPARIGRALVSNREWLEFMDDDGYTKS